MKQRWIRFLRSGYDEPIYDNFKKEINAQNHRMVQTTSFIGSIMMILLTIAALFVPSVSKVLPLYFTVAILFTVIYVITRISGINNRVVTIICNYAFLTAAFFFAIGLDVIQGNATATTVCVLLVSLPLLIVDRPYREFIYFLLVSVCFMYESVYIKQSPKASIDVLNAVSFFMVGTFLGYRHNQMVLRNIKGHSMLEVQRDRDTLTSLYNKGALESKARELLNQTDMKASLIVIDMDNFKYVNDTYGHHTGDELLTKIANILSSLFRSNDLIGRFGGDEFVIFMPMNDKEEILKSRAEKILSSIDRIRLSKDEDYRAHVCMGIAVYPKDGQDYDELFRKADAAMYVVKKNGKNGYGFYNESYKTKILLVDDIEVNRASLAATLCEEYSILEAEDGKAALELLEEHNDIALVITDIQMPNMDGIELIKHIRREPRYNELAIIANTQLGDITQEEEMFRIGVDDFVYKAASPSAVKARVKNILKAKNEM